MLHGSVSGFVPGAVCVDDSGPVVYFEVRERDTPPPPVFPSQDCRDFLAPPHTHLRTVCRSSLTDGVESLNGCGWCAYSKHVHSSSPGARHTCPFICTFSVTVSEDRCFSCLPGEIHS